MQLATPASADLPTRGELLKESYDEDRAKGIIALNRRYIESYQQELDALLKAKKLQEANAVQAYIKALEAEKPWKRSERRRK